MFNIILIQSYVLKRFFKKTNKEKSVLTLNNANTINPIRKANKVIIKVVRLLSFSAFSSSVSVFFFPYAFSIS